MRRAGIVGLVLLAAFGAVLIVSAVGVFCLLTDASVTACVLDVLLPL